MLFEWIEVIGGKRKGRREGLQSGRLVEKSDMGRTICKFRDFLASVHGLRAFICHSGAKVRPVEERSRGEHGSAFVQLVSRQTRCKTQRVP
jgi:hypothetical protein